MLHPNPKWVRVRVRVGPVPIRNVAGDRRKGEGVKNGQPVPGKSPQGNRRGEWRDERTRQCVAEERADQWHQGAAIAPPCYPPTSPPPQAQHPATL